MRDVTRDAHDPREFRRWVTLNDDGTVAAVHLVVATATPDQNDGTMRVDVSALGQMAVDHLTVEATVVADHKKAKTNAGRAALAATVVSTFAAAKARA